MKTLYLVFLKQFFKNMSNYHILHILWPFWNWFYPCTLFIHVECINVKGGDIQLKVISFHICSYSCTMARWPFRGAFWEHNSHIHPWQMQAQTWHVRATDMKHTHERHNT